MAFDLFVIKQFQYQMKTLLRHLIKNYNFLFYVKTITIINHYQKILDLIRSLSLSMTKFCLSDMSNSVVLAQKKK